MVPGLAPLRDRRWGALATAIGVTRLARLTGLDRSGVPVAAAIRPAGHVLQVSNGKGETFARAAAGALLEAAELWASERPRVAAFGSAAELSGAARLVPPASLDPGAAGSEGIRIAWAAARDLGSGERLLVPAHAVFCPPAGSAWLGPALVAWTSNGTGAHPEPSAALLHALLEAIERDRVARALPEGFTEREVARRLLDPRSLAAAAPRAAGWADRITGRGLRVHLLDLSFPARGLPGRGGRRPRAGPDLGLPCAAALVVDPEGGPVPVAAGYACRLSRDAALLAALLEAAQSRLTEIHGAREDVARGDRHGAAPLARWCERARPARRASELPHVPARSPAAGVRTVLGRLRRAGFAPAAVRLDGPPGIHVVRVVVPGLRLSELL
jgi:ribosomal protein S12 methylthiotransferase accessory factor